MPQVTVWFRLGIFTQQDLHDIVSTLEKRQWIFWPDTAVFGLEPAIKPFNCGFNDLNYSKYILDVFFTYISS